MVTPDKDKIADAYTDNCDTTAHISEHFLAGYKAAQGRDAASLHVAELERRIAAAFALCDLADHGHGAGENGNLIHPEKLRAVLRFSQLPEP